jgi:nucleoside-diphosphate-sugar epimerase
MAAPPEDTRDRREWDYGMGKRAAEATLRLEASALGFPALALRLPVVQGENDGSLRLWAWLERMRDGGPVLLPDGGVQPARFVYAADAAASLLRLAETANWPAASALNLSQPADIPLKDFLELAASLAGLRPRFAAVGGEELAAAGLADTCAPYWGRWCSRPDPAAAFALGFAAHGPEDYLPSVVRAHMDNPPASSHPGYARRAEELALAAKMLE